MVIARVLATGGVGELCPFNVADGAFAGITGAHLNYDL